MNTLILLLASFLSFTPLCCASCANTAEKMVHYTSLVKKAHKSGDSVTLRIANSEDYIAGDPNNISSDKSNGVYNLIGEFVDYVKKTDGVNITVSYSTFDTMENMLSKAQTGGNVYDLVCVSDYIIQKMMTLSMLTPFSVGDERTALYGGSTEGWDDNYSLYASKYLQNALNGIYSTVNGVSTSIGLYARGYMWGTLGLLYNPSFSTFSNNGLSEDDVKVQMSDWNVLWDDAYYQTFQVKDSMRDTYSIGLMHVFDSYFKVLSSWYQNGVDNEGNSYDKDAYNADVSLIFNNINHIDEFNALARKIVGSTYEDVDADRIVDEIQNALSTLKDTSFGLETDSGKTDILTGDKSGIDCAWSGDAVTAMDNADALGNTLYYSIPETGGNIWFDAWVMMKSDSLEQEYAQKFIDFISDPAQAAPNMDYIGYTSFIAGDDVLSLVRDWYDARSFAMYVYSDDLGDYIYDDDENKVYKDGSGKKKVKAEVDGKEKEIELDYGENDMTGSDYDSAKVDGVAASWSSIADEEGWKDIDLTYFFADSLSSYGDSDMHFYSSEIEEVTGKGLDGEEKTVMVGRQFLAQYPTEDEAYKGTVLDQIPGLAIMEDYGDNNTYILRMWENVKSGGTIQPWIVVVLCVEGTVAIAIVGYLLITKKTSKRLRKRRREEKKEA
ncbi:MAG: extracellular solute-binding protein [Bacilli bacterium]|jgi:spermidine/putrescine transport system substrate-binding protein|nr:extracellular solute-binding protein [Bacilli bacterium]MCH4228460.1 extracellular solute-binding protein [Bacilli bacterium]MCH4277606.1 extracellular solute-binding protein [Bacilli bacterium]MCI2054945.1 extracellular solute-binding protein [Bacilli bacterium]